MYYIAVTFDPITSGTISLFESELPHALSCELGEPASVFTTRRWGNRDNSLILEVPKFCTTTAQYAADVINVWSEDVGIPNVHAYVI